MFAWNNNGSLPAPYSGPNVPGAGTDLEMYGPSQVRVDNGLTLTAQRNTNPYSGAYPWISGVVTTEGKFSLPTTGWYVQARIKVPDTTQGLWPSMWFLPAGPGPFDEIDFVQGGFYGGPGNVDDAPVGAGYFDSAGDIVNEAVPDVGFDASAGYHTYGIQWTPGVGIDEYVDGNLVWTVTESEVPGGIVAQAYEIILDLQVAATADAGWRTVTTATSPGGSMDVAEVQAYSSRGAGLRSRIEARLGAVRRLSDRVPIDWSATRPGSATKPGWTSPEEWASTVTLSRERERPAVRPCPRPTPDDIRSCHGTPS